MGHYYSEMMDPSPIYSSEEKITLEDFAAAKQVLKQQHLWDDSYKVTRVRHEKMKTDSREWIEINYSKSNSNLRYVGSFSVTEFNKAKDERVN